LYQSINDDSIIYSLVENYLAGDQKTCNLTGKDSQYTEIILPIMDNASIMLDAFRYLLCSKLCQHNRLVPIGGTYIVFSRKGLNETPKTTLANL